MMALQPWYKVVFPREDLREGKPLDASEFAVHLDRVRDGTAVDDYRVPERFFSRSYMTRNLLDLGAEVLRRLSGIRLQTSAVFNLVTQFGGGKTHALTLLYHLGNNGRKAEGWAGVDRLMAEAGVSCVPKAAVATFVGTEFDPVTGRGGDDGTPVRKTPWGEIAWQLGREESFAAVAEHEDRCIAPAGDVIRKMLPKDRPSLILMDEVIAYTSRGRSMGLNAKVYDFLQSMSETARSESNVALVASLPSSDYEIMQENQTDYQRYAKLLDRVGKAIVMSAETETAEIIRRRLFEWDGLTRDAEKTIAAYADWLVANRTQIPGWFPVDTAREALRATYPFHPAALSVFERKWQQLPRFQQTRGVLRLLALWVSQAFQEGFKGAHKDPLIGLGTAPLDAPFFRTAAFEQLGESKLEGAVTTDIAGAKSAHAMQLDREAGADIKKARLHQKVATTIFFESNGGMMRAEATVPEVRLAVGEPDIDIGNIETVLETLADSCYYLSIERNRYRFSISPNLNKLLSDRRATIDSKGIEQRCKAEILKVFPSSMGVEVKAFPEKTSDIPDRPVLMLAVMDPKYAMDEAEVTAGLAKKMTWECGRSGRTFKSAIIWVVADSAQSLREEARKLLAWEAIKDEADELRLDDRQKRQLQEQLGRSKRDLAECVWRTYKNVLLLGKDNELRHIDLGLVNSSQADSMVEVVLRHLREVGEVVKTMAPTVLARRWPGMTEWSTEAVRNAFFASPVFPRLLNADEVKEIIARGVTDGVLGYVGKQADGHYVPFLFDTPLEAEEVEISDELFIVQADEAKKHIEPPKLTALQIRPEQATVKPGEKVSFEAGGLDQHGRAMKVKGVVWSAKGGQIDDGGTYSAGKDEGQFTVRAAAGDVEAQAAVRIAAGDVPPPPPPPTKGLHWTGEVPAQKWMNFYTKVLAKFATGKDLKVTVRFDVTPEAGVPQQQADETKSALHELGLDDDVSLS